MSIANDCELKAKTITTQITTQQYKHLKTQKEKCKTNKTIGHRNQRFLGPPKIKKFLIGDIIWLLWDLISIK